MDKPVLVDQQNLISSVQTLDAISKDLTKGMTIESQWNLCCWHTLDDYVENGSYFKYTQNSLDPLPLCWLGQNTPTTALQRVSRVWQ